MLQEVSPEIGVWTWEAVFELDSELFAFSWTGSDVSFGSYQPHTSLQPNIIFFTKFSELRQEQRTLLASMRSWSWGHVNSRTYGNAQVDGYLNTQDTFQGSPLITAQWIIIWDHSQGQAIIEGPPLTFKDGLSFPDDSDFELTTWQKK